ncbi:MAG: ADOP family duplicated permease [Vicinamibacterales bacterium]
MTRLDGRSLLWRTCRTFYRAWLWWYPPAFRREHGDEAARLFADVCAADGPRARARRVTRALFCVPRDGLRERRATAWHHAAPRSLRLDGLARDLAGAVRSVRRRPGLMAAVVATLALGIGANTAMFSVADALLLRFLPYPDADRVVYLRVRSQATGRLRDPTSAELHRWREHLQSFERIEGRSWKSVLLTGDAGATRVRMLQITSGFLDALRVVPLAGRLLHPSDSAAGAPPVVLLSKSLWMSRYGKDSAVLGSTLVIDGAPHLVVGVIDDVRSDTPGLRINLYAPLPRNGAAADAVPARGIAWLRPGVSVEAAQQETGVVTAAVGTDGRREHGAVETPRNIFLQVAEFRNVTVALLAATFLLFAVAWVNVAAMLLAAARARSGELALRGALGASRARLVQGLLLESLVLSLIGCAAGLLIARAAIGAFAMLDPAPQLSAGLEAARIDWRVLAYAALLSLGTALAVGGWAAFRSSGPSLTAVLHESGNPRAGRRRTSGLFIAAQTALSLVLMVAAGLTGRAFLTMRLAEPGFAADRILFVRLSLPEDAYATPAGREAFYTELIDGAKSLPGVVGAGLGYGAVPPSDFNVIGALRVEDGGAPRSDFNVETSYVAPSHFELMGIPLVAGRPFDEFDGRPAGAAETPAIVSRALAQHLWPDRHPVGSGFEVASPRRTHRYRVVGVAADVRGQDLEWLDHPSRGWHLYLPLPENRRYTEVILRVADGQPLPVADLRALVRRIDPRVPADDELMSGAASLFGKTRRARFRAVLFGTFAISALTLCALGIAAVVGHQVSRRTREVGVRIALGARPDQVRRLIVRQGLVPVAGGMAAGLVAAVGAARALRSFLPGVSPADFATLAIVLAVISAVVLVAIWVPVRRATRIDPIAALRAD